MRGTAWVAFIALAGAISFMASAKGQIDDDVAPIYGVKLPPGYRDWTLISVAGVGPPVNSLRAAGDNEAARKTVLELAEAIGFDPVDAGPLKNARSCASRNAAIQNRRCALEGCSNQERI